MSETLSDLDAEVRDGNTVIVLPEEVLFEFDHADLLPDAAATLDRIAEAITYFEGAPVEVSGHTDSPGQTERGRARTSERRTTVNELHQVNGLEGTDIDPVDRMLLSTDGTVTSLLAACTGEPIITRATRRAGPATLERLLEATGWWWHPDASILDLSPVERVVARRVSLRGGCSGLAYVLAESLVVPDRLPHPIADGLTHEGASLGRLLTAGPVETRREILQITAAPADEAACDHLGVQPGATLAQRTYRIVVGQRAAAAVTEWLCPGRLAAAARRNTRNRADRPASTIAGPQ